MVLSAEAQKFARQFLIENEGVIRAVKDASGAIKTVLGPCKPGEQALFPVYDDADTKNVWLPGCKSYDDWAKTLKGKPTLGYGMRYDLMPQQLKDEYVRAGGNVGLEWILKGLDTHIDAIMETVMKRHPNIAVMTPAQQGALASFFYNLGPSPTNKETLEKALQANDMNAIHSALALYCKVGGKVLSGLVARRDRERAPFSADAPATQPASAVQVASADGYEIRQGDTLWGLWKNRTDQSETWDAFSKRIRQENPAIDFEKPIAVGTHLNGIKLA
ncbi:MAG: glycoside hydrolase family protein [Victivallales bacterium]|nr:glycoside hydrolase family protein [Victivallales bacterium]